MSLRGSPGDLTKIVMNLMINAFDSFNGPGEITVATENIYIDGMKIGTTDIGEGEYEHLSVADTGCGITATGVCEAGADRAGVRTAGRGCTSS